MVEGTGLKIQHLNADNYGTWKVDMRALLITKRLWSAVIEDDRFQALQPVEQQNMVEEAQSYMVLYVSRSLKGMIHMGGSARDTWRAIMDYFQSHNRARATDLHTKLMSIRQGHKEKVIEYLLRVHEMKMQLRDCGEVVSDALVNSAALNGVHKRFAQMAETLRCQSDLSWDMLGQRLVAAEARYQIKEEANEGKALAHMGSKKKQDQKTCFNCGKPGHFKKDCKAPKKEDKHAEGKEKEATMLAVVATSPNNWEDVGEEAILFDTGASHHICNTRAVFAELSPSAVATVACGGGEIHPVVGQGTAVVNTENGLVLLQDALCVPTLRANLMSWPAASSRGVSLQGIGESLHVVKGSRTVLTATKSHGVFLIDGALKQSSAEVYAVSAATWHKRLGHPSNAVLSRMLQNEMVDGLTMSGKVEVSDKCDVCFEGKQSKLPFELSKSKASRPLELVHSDMIGKFHVESRGGSFYALTMLDDFSRYSEVICVRFKSDVPDALMNCLQKWERQTGEKVRSLRTDGGTEYRGVLRDRLSEAGVEHQTTVRYSPQQNGRAERLNRTLLEKTRCILFEAKLPKKMWAEAITTANYLRNVTATSVDDKTPYEAFHKVKPDLSLLKVFGCLAHVHIPKARRKKLDERSFKAIFVGYEAGTKGWKVMTRKGSRWKMIITRDAVFEEDKMAYPQLISNIPEEKDDHVHELLEEPTAEDEDTDDDEDASSTDESETSDEEDDASDDEGEGKKERPQLVPQSKKTRFLRDIISGNGTAMATKADWDAWDNPPTLEVVRNREDAQLWEESMNEELRSLMEKDVYEEVPLPPGCKALPSRWVYKIKRDDQGKVDKYKSRYVAKGYLQRLDDEDSSHAPTSSTVVLRILLAMAAQEDWDIEQMDVKTAFLNGELDEDVYMKPPPGFEGKGIVWKLKKAIYGLKQAASAWHKTLQKSLTGAGFQTSSAEPCLYMFGPQDERVFVLVYVDDCLLFGPTQAVAAVKRLIASLFDVKDVGPATYFLGLQIKRERDARTLWLGQQRYVNDVLERFGMAECKPRVSPLDANLQLDDTGEPLGDGTPYNALVGSLLYLAVQTRPDISHAVGMLSRFVASPKEQHWAAAKSVLKYLAGTREFALKFHGSSKAVGYTDADFAGEKPGRKSTSGMVILMNGAAVAWASKLQGTVATSTCEAELIAGALAVKECLYVSKLLADLTEKYMPLDLYGDNQSALRLMKNVHAGAQNRTKHIDIAYNFARQRVMLGEVQVHFVGTADMVADVMTKQLPGPSFRKHRDTLGLCG